MDTNTSTAPLPKPINATEIDSADLPTRVAALEDAVSKLEGLIADASTVTGIGADNPIIGFFEGIAQKFFRHDYEAFKANNPS